MKNLINNNFKLIDRSFTKDIEPIVVNSGESLNIIEYFDGIDSPLLKRDIVLKNGSSLEYVKFLKNSNSELEYNIECESDTKLLIHFFEFGNSSLNRVSSKLSKENIDIKINSLVKLNNEDKVFNSFNIIHDHQNTYSDIKVRHLLDDKSKADFEATTVIENRAVYSKAFQDSKTILLSDDAFIKARPHLEILTDELEASHGAVTGGLDRDALYYLQSRGISEEKARDILVEAFYMKMVDLIEDEDMKKWIIGKITFK